MLDAIKNALTFYSEPAKLEMTCTNVSRVGNTINVSLEFKDMLEDKVVPISTSMKVPSIVEDGTTLINIAICKGGRSGRVFNNGNITIGRYSDEWTIDYTHRDELFKVMHNRNVVFPPMNQTPNGSMVQSIPSTMIFNYYPGLVSETLISIPKLTADGTKLIDSFAADFELSESAYEAIQIYSKGMLKDRKFNAELLQAFLYMLDNKVELVDKVLPIDYEVGTYENLIRDSIKRQSKVIGIKVMNSYRRTGTVSLYPILSAIQDVSRTDRSNGLNVVQSDMNTNALSHLAQRDKTYFKVYDTTEKKYVPETLDPKYFVGIIDPVFTADSALINVKNELARSAVISDEKFKIKLMTPDFKPVIVSSYEYLSSIVLSQDNVDYVNKKLVPSESGDYNVYQWGEDFYIKDPSKIQYIRYEDSIISETVALMPFANKTQAINKIVA